MRSHYVDSRQIKSLAVTVIAVFLVACGEAPEPAVKEISRPVKMLTLGGDIGGATLEYPGEISASQSVELGFEVPGKIVELLVMDGQKVTENELLARLDPVDYETARDSAASVVTALGAAHTRAKKIFDLGAGSQSEVDLTLRDIQVAREDLKKAQKALDDTSLKAPFNGEIARKLAENFQNVQAKEPILLIQDISSLEIDVSVPEQDFALATPGLSIEERNRRVSPEIMVSSVSDRRFPARFKSLSTAADAVTRTYTATFAFANPGDVNIFPGMTAKVIMHLPEDILVDVGRGGFMIPAAASAADEQDNAYVWRVDQDTLRVSRTPVELGQMAGNQVRVLSGLDGGDRIAISGVHHLREGMLVRPLDE